MKNESPARSRKSESWFKDMRSADTLELIQKSPNAFSLAFIVAFRARWSSSFSADDLQPGEAMLGDFKSYGMTEQEYRTAKQQLKKWKFATFRTTNEGTIGKLIDTRLFCVSTIADNDPDNTPATNGKRMGNGQSTTNYKDIRKEGNKRIDNSPRNFVPE